MNEYIDLKFNPRGEYGIKEGLKTATTRRTKHGEAGDYFMVGKHVHRLEEIKAMKLKDIAAMYYFREGYKKPAHFLMAIDRIYGKTSRDTIMYVHLFN